MLHPVLLVPGPVNLSLRVQEALRRPELSPWQAEYHGLAARLRDALLALYGASAADWECVLLPGQDLHAVEAMLMACPNQGEIGIVVQGVLGERMLRIAQRLQRAHRVLSLPGRILDIETLSAWLEQHPAVRYLALAQGEPSDGLLNDLQCLAPWCGERGVNWLLDASISFGAEFIDMSNWPVAAMAAAADRALHGAGGTAFVLARREWSGQAPPAPSLSLDLAYWREAAAAGASKDSHVALADALSLPAALPSQTLQALNMALQELQEQGGWNARRRRYLRLHEGIGRVVRRYGMTVLEGDAPGLAAVRRYRLPGHLSVVDFCQQLRWQGFIAAPAVDDDASLLSLAVMGDLDELQISRLHHALEDILHPPGVKIKA